MFKQLFNFVLERISPASYLILNQPFALGFKTTNYCNYSCAHCIENAGVGNQKTFMDAGVIKGYIIQAKNNPKFSTGVVLTGGEIFAAYDSNQNYIPDLLNFCMGQRVHIDIKTNGAWVNTSAKEPVLNDLKKLTHSVPTIPENGDPIRLAVGMTQISLSLDRYHKDSLKNTSKIITEIVKNRDSNMMFHIASFAQDEKLQDKLLNALVVAGLNLDECRDNLGKKVIVLNKNNILRFSCAVLMQAGRAKNLNESEPVTYPEFKILSPDYNILMFFRDDGWVILGENCGPKIKTKWQKKNGDYKSLKRIRLELVWNAFLAHKRIGMGK